MNWVCNYCIPPPLTPCSLSLIHPPYIIVKESYSQNHSLPILPGVTEELMTWQKWNTHPPLHLEMFRPIGREGRRDYLVPQFTLRHLELRVLNLWSLPF